VDLGPSPVQLNNGGSGPAQQIYIYNSVISTRFVLCYFV